MKSSTQAERRRQPRIELHGVTRVRLLPAGRRGAHGAELTIGDGTLFDLSAAGAFIATDLKLEKGTFLELEIESSGDEAMSLSAVVARRGKLILESHRPMPPGLGLTFIATTAEARSRVHRIVLATVTLDLLSYGYESRLGAPFSTLLTVPPLQDEEAARAMREAFAALRTG